MSLPIQVILGSMVSGGLVYAYRKFKEGKNETLISIKNATKDIEATNKRFDKFEMTIIKELKSLDKKIDNISQERYISELAQAVVYGNGKRDEYFRVKEQIKGGVFDVSKYNND